MFLAVTARGTGSSCSMIIMLILFFGLMWFFVIRPEKKKLHEKSGAMRNVKKKERSKLRKRLKDYAVYALLCIFALAGLVFIFKLMGSELKEAIFMAVMLIVISVVGFKILQAGEETKEDAKRKREEDERRFKSGEMKGAERAAYAKKQLDYAMGAYHRGAITFLDLQVLQKMYTGKSMIDDFGLGVVAAASRKYQVNRAIEKQQKSATGSMIINAAVGEAIAGTAGAVIGAATSAQKSSQEAAALAAEKASAEQALNKAIEDSITRRI